MGIAQTLCLFLLLATPAMAQVGPALGRSVQTDVNLELPRTGREARSAADLPYARAGFRECLEVLSRGDDGLAIAGGVMAGSAVVTALPAAIRAAVEPDHPSFRWGHLFAAAWLPQGVIGTGLLVSAIIARTLPPHERFRFAGLPAIDAQPVVWATEGGGGVGFRGQW